MYLFDTNIVSNLMRAAPSRALHTKLSQVSRNAAFISSITLAEIVYGACLNQTRTTVILRLLEEIVVPTFAILPFDTGPARRFGEIKAALGRQGIVIDNLDMQIGCTALAHNMTVVTANTRDFERIPGLQVENWLG